MSKEKPVDAYKIAEPLAEALFMENYMENAEKYYEETMNNALIAANRLKDLYEMIYGDDEIAFDKTMETIQGVIAFEDYKFWRKCDE